MTRCLTVVFLLASTAACAQMSQPSPALVTDAGQVASAALAAYQAALGAAEQAEAGDPAVEAVVQSITAAAAPYVADAQTAAAQAATAPTLAALSAELLLDAAPHITVVPNGK